MNALPSLLLAAVLAAATPTLAAAAEYPTRPITLIGAYAAGGSTHMVLQSISDIAARALGQPIVVEAKPGAGGTLGPAAGAKAKPDGYTLIHIPVAIFRYPHMTKNVTFDPLTDFTPIIQLSGVEYGVVVRSDSPWKDWRELIGYAKANPAKVTYATPGVGSTGHLIIEEIAAKEGVKLTHIPMKGGAQTIPAVLGGHVQAVADTTLWNPQVQAGDLRLLVTWGERRLKRYPNVPTLKDVGYQIVFASPFGIAGPRGLPAEIVRKLHDAYRKAMDDPAWLKVLDQLDMQPLYLGPEDYAKEFARLYNQEKANVERVGLRRAGRRPPPHVWILGPGAGDPQRAGLGALSLLVRAGHQRPRRCGHRA